MSAVKYYVLIVGGGSGSRMKSDVPKQFLLLDGKPVLMHTIEAFHHSGFDPGIIVVLNVDFHQYWEELCLKHNFNIPHQLVRGGLQRFHSVKNGLKYITGKSIIAIHDAVRPVVSREIIGSCFQTAESAGTAVAAIKSSDSVRSGTADNNISLNRGEIFLIQTPQAFRSDILLKAYKQDYRNEFTDDASVVERSGRAITLVPGDKRNLKITFPEDILIGELYLKDQK